MLSILIAEADRLVPVERIIDATWSSGPPASVRNRVHTLISSLRRKLGSHLIVTRPAGYVLSLDDRPKVLDSALFDELVDQGRGLVAIHDLAGAAEVYSAALALWRGSAYEDMHSPHLLAEAARLAELRRAAAEEYAQAQLERGAHAQVLTELTSMVGQDPLHDRLRGYLMLALYRSGRQAEALEVFEAGAHLLAEEYGLDPGEELRSLRQAILRDDPSLAAAPRSAAVPCQLPASIGDFVGREAELKWLEELLSEPASGHCEVVSIAGMGGVGKTTLAIHAAHRLQASYPDGCLYADMRGKEPFTVLGSFLRGYGQPNDRLPDDLDERAALFRSILSGRRTLLVLDNVSDERQIRPLIPGGLCALLLTGRRALTGLAGVHLLNLDVMPSQESLRLLAKVAGEQRVQEDQSAALAIVDLCGRLPLALRIVGVRMAQHRALPTATLAERLAHHRQRLDELVTADLDIRASIAMSWQQLDAASLRLIEMLSQLPLRSYTPWLSAGLLAVPIADAHRRLQRLEEAQLLRSADDEHYQMHDLVRLFALEQARKPAPVTAAYQALLAHAVSAARQLPCHVIPIRPPSRPVPPVTDPAQWLEKERENLVLAVEHCRQRGERQLATSLAMTLANFSIVYGTYDDWQRSHLALLKEAGRPGLLTLDDEARIRVSHGNMLRMRNRPEQAIAQLRLGYRQALRCGDVELAISACLAWSVSARMLGRTQVAQAVIGRAFSHLSVLPHEDVLSGYAFLAFGVLTCNHRPDADEGMAALRRALEIFDKFDETWAAATTHTSLGGLLSRRGEEGAVAHLRTAIALQAEIGDRTRLAQAELHLASVHLSQGRGELARPALLGCLRTFRDLRDPWGVGTTLRLLGSWHLSAGEPAQACSLLEWAVEQLRITGQPYAMARALQLLGEARLAAGQPERACAAGRQAWEIFNELGAVDAENVALWLSGFQA